MQGVSDVTENPEYISISDMFVGEILKQNFEARLNHQKLLLKGAPPSQNLQTLELAASSAMPLRCLVVDCGGVTHPDSGLKEAWMACLLLGK